MATTYILQCSDDSYYVGSSRLPVKLVYTEEYETLNEAEEFGYEVTFGANSTDESIQSAFKTGRAIGEIEGKIDQLNTFLNFFYTQEQTKEG